MLCLSFAFTALPASPTPALPASPTPALPASPTPAGNGTL